MAHPPILGTYFATFLNQTIFPSIIQGVSQRGITITNDELMTMVGVPSRTSTASLTSLQRTTPFPGITPFPGASHLPGSNVVPQLAEGRCVRPLSKGKLKGQPCGKKAQPGSTLCTSCSNVGTRRPRGKKSKMEVSELSEITDINQDDETPSVNVAPFDLEQGLLRDLNHGFILKQFPDRVVVYGRVNNGETVIMALEPDEQRQAEAMGFSLV